MIFFQVILRACLLGLGTSLGIHLVLLSFAHSPELRYLTPLGLYFSAMCVFHFTEFLTMALNNPFKVTLGNFLFSYSDKP